MIEVPIHRTVDPDVVKATEAIGESGARQLRVVQIEELYYMDTRDVGWLIVTYEQHLAMWRQQSFWSQVVIATLMQYMHNTGHDFCCGGANIDNIPCDDCGTGY